MAAFRQGLSESGYIEGQNVAVERLQSLPMLADDLVRCQVSVGTRAKKTNQFDMRL
jgi:hypothetical protein